MHYVISDIHGDMDKFQKMLRAIRLHWWDRLIILGDVIDRGPDGLEILKYIMEHRNIILLKGNHERDMCSAVMQPAGKITEVVLDLFELWFANGGEVTYRSLLEKSEEEAYRLLDYANGLKSHLWLSVRGRKYLLVHAGFIWSPYCSLEKNIDANEKMDFLFDLREGFLDRTQEMPFTVIAGHTPTEFLPEYMRDLTQEEEERCREHKMLIRQDKILTDCGCGHGNNLGCLRLEDGREFYVN